MQMRDGQVRTGGRQPRGWRASAHHDPPGVPLRLLLVQERRGGELEERVGGRRRHPGPHQHGNCGGAERGGGVRLRARALLRLGLGESPGLARAA